MSRVLLIAGVVLIALGLTWRWLSRVPLLRLPGDLLIERPGFRLFLPLTTMLIVSAVLSLIAWLLRR